MFRGELDWIVLKALEKDRNRRYDTASSFAADVQCYLDDEPVQACPPTLARRAAKWSRRHKSLVGAAVVVGVLAALIGAGNLFWLAQKRAEAAGRVQETLRRAGELQTQGKWVEALEAAQNAEDLLQLGGGSRDLKQRVQALLKDLQMIRRLEDIRLEEQAVGDGSLDDLQDISFEYVQAFRNYGVDVDTLNTEEAARRIRDRPIHVELAAALDHWAQWRLRTLPRAGEDPIWRHLLEVAQAADPDPWRNQLRSALERSPLDKKILQDLADSAELAAQPAPTLHLLGTSLADAGMLDPAERVLRQAQQWHADNFWINADLAACLSRLNKRVEEVAVRTALVSLRPQSARARHELGQALVRQGDLQQGIATLNQATGLQSEDSSIEVGWDNAPNTKGDVDKALASFQAASRLQPDQPGIYINWGSYLKNQNALEKAVAVYDQALAALKKEPAGQRRPGSFRALLRLATVGRVEALFGVMLALIIVVCIAAILTIGNNIDETAEIVSSAIQVSSS